jgi:hypothetical protein
MKMTRLHTHERRSGRGAAVAACLIALAAVTLSLAPGARAAQNPCGEFDRAVKATYNFKPSRLKDEAESDAKSAAMDRFWERVKADKASLLPCLRNALRDPQSDPWFRFDGSNLLVSLDPSPASKAEQVRQYTAADLADVNLQVWVSTLARLGAEGFDVSEAGARWLALPKAEYYLHQHGAFKVDRLLGAIFIYGGMDEAQATPALLKIADAPDHPGREIALSLLLMQATPEAFRGLKGLNPAGLSADTRAGLRRQLENPKMITPREKPKTSREQFLKAFGEAAGGRWKSFFKLVSEVPDGEKDVVAALRAEDVPLVRKVRRAMIANANPHAAEYYVSFTQILTTLIWRPEMSK